MLLSADKKQMVERTKVEQTEDSQNLIRENINW